MTENPQLPVFYINLDSRQDRRAFMEEQFGRLSMAAERFPAVTMDEVPPELVARHADPRHLWPVSNGDLACGLSHQAIWRMMVERGLQAALVLEDDAILSDRVRDFLDDDILARTKCDVLKLETRRKHVLLGGKLGSVGSSALHELQSSHMGGAAYILNLGTARASLASPQVNDFGVDRFLFGKAGPHLLRSRILQVVPSPVVQLDRLDPSPSYRPEGAARSDLSAPRNDRVRAPRRLPALGSLVTVNVDHVGRLLRLAARDASVIGRRRKLVPYADDPAKSTEAL